MSSTKYKVSPYAILEYIYGTDEKTIADANFYKISNIARKSTVFVNDNQSSTFSNNCLDLSFIELSDNTRMGHNDLDRSFTLSELDSNIDINYDLNIPIETLVKYDTIRIHVLAGYNLNGLDAIGLRMYGEENDTSAGSSFLLSYIHTLEENLFVRNNKTFTLGDQVYDKYLEIKVPSLSWINSNFYSTSIYNDKTLGKILTASGKGFKQESLIKFEFFHFVDYTEIDDKPTYKYTIVSKNAIPQIDNNSLIAANVQESDEGDYFEFFATYDGEFIEDYLNSMKSNGQNYIIVNEIKIYENYTDLTRKLVQEIPIIQTSDFDKPNIFRPIISNNAYSFNIDYTIRLINQTDNTQIVKESFLACDTKLARKYGKFLNKISINNSSNKIYNRIKENKIVVNSPVIPNTAQQATYQKEIFRFINSYNLSISSESMIPNTNNITYDNLMTDNMVYGNGEGAILLNRYDNYLKINLFTKNADDSTNKIDLSSLFKNNSEFENFYLVFTDNKNSKKYISCNKSLIKDNSLVFNINNNDSNKIIAFFDNSFDLIYVNSIKEETLLYQGKFFKDFNEIRTYKETLINSILKETLKNNA